MAGRAITWLMLTSCLLLLPADLFAQAGRVRLANYNDEAEAPSSNIFQTEHVQAFPASMRAYPQTAHAPTVQAVVPLNGPTAGQFDPSQMQANTPYYSPNGVITERIGDQDWWDESGPLEKALTNLVTNTWVRFEAGVWSVSKPGPVLLGAPVLNTAEPRFPFPAVLPPAFVPVGTARVPSLDNIELNDGNMGKVTYGVPLTFGQFELSAMGLEQIDDRDTALDLLQQNPVNFIATSTLVNGAIANNLQVYDDRYSVLYETDLWDTEALVAFDVDGYGEGWHFKPLAGIRIAGLQERSTQVGVFNAQDTVADLVSVIETDTSNFNWGLTAGLRGELEHRWFTLGVEPKASLGLNHARSRVRTLNFRSLADGEVVTEAEDITFSPMLEFNVYGRIHLHKNFSLTASYHVLWLARMQRASNGTRYDDLGPLPTPPAVTARNQFEGVTAHGFFVGGEIWFR